MLMPDIFKANDIRGLAGGPDAEWDEDGAFALGAAFVDALELAGKTFVMSRDMRVTGPVLAAAFARGAMSRGADVIDIGLASTDGLWFASGRLDLPGVQFTASHNPAGYNGIKFCKAGAAPVTSAFICDLAARAAQVQAPVAKPGRLTHQDLLPAYGDYLRSLVDLDGIRRLKVVVDAGNGMAGHTTGSVLGPLNLDIVGLYLDLDGNFPNHQPNPLIPENLVDAQAAVVKEHADIALVFDGDADRCFIIDERGEVVSPSIVTALIAQQELAREPHSTIVVNTITSQVVGEVVEESGGQLAISKVGHTYVKALMAQHNAIFGGEHSAHYYFRDFWRADTGILAALHCLAILGHQDQPLSQLIAGYERYVASGEINSTVQDAKAAMQAVATAFAHEKAEQEWDDGLLIRGEHWWVSVRASNTEPLLRLNVEAADTATMERLRDRALATIRGGHTA
ncbi:MAG: phosphomannomutase/phosphoglucomutase [Propionibacteriaceae bacterium]